MASILRPLLGLLAFLLNPAGRLWCAAEVKRDFYEVLELSRDATPADVKKAYKQLARRYHPDKNRAADAQQRFIEIQRAHEVLSDPDKRQEYDSRAGYFVNVDIDSDDNRRDVFGRRTGPRGPPDGGRGKILNTGADINAAIHGGDLWLLHVYSDDNEQFGSWMRSLPEMIHLGHVNIERSNELAVAAMRMVGGHIDSLPILVYVQRGRRHAFRLPYASMFFGPLGVVTEQALEFIDYWEKLVPLRGNADLRDFLSFAPGSHVTPEFSSRLRVVFIFENRQERHFEVIKAVSKLKGYAHVGQLGYYDSLDMYGQATGILATLRLRRLPSLVLFDPLHGKHVLYASDRAVDAAGELAMQLIESRPSRAVDFFPIQEFDEDMHSLLCGNDGGRCSWVLLLATSTVLEHKEQEFATALHSFSKACETLTGVQARLHTTFKCFWLRHGLNRRARDWRALLSQKHQKGSGPDGYTIAALSREEAGTAALAIATAEEALSSRSLFIWFQNAMHRNSRIAHVDVQWPAMPTLYDPSEPMQPSEEPEADEPVDWEAKLSELARRIERAGRTCKAWLEDIMRTMDGEAVAMYAFTVSLFIACCFIVLWVMSSKSEMSEEEVLRSLEFWVTVSLKKQEGKRFGFGIGGDHPHGRLRVGALAEGGLLEAWNANVISPERSVQEGDYIAYVGDADTGQAAVTALAMKRQLLEASGVIMTAVLSPKLRPGLERLTATFSLEGLVLADCAQFGKRADERSNDLEVLLIHPALHEWNAMRRREGASCFTTLEIGDRIVSVNGHTRVEQHLHARSPKLLVVKWRMADRLVSERFNVELERELQEQWGLKLGLRERQIEVNSVVPNSVAARWKPEVASNGTGIHRVLPGDRLVMVNGKQGVEDISKELRALKVVLCFERWLDKGSCKADLECETSTNGNTKVNANDAAHPVGTAEGVQDLSLRQVQADILEEHLDLGTMEVQDGWDVDPELDVPKAADTRVIADATGAAAVALVESAGSETLAEEHQVKQPEDAGWDVGLEFDATMAAIDDVPAASTDNFTDGMPGAQPQHPIESTAEKPGNTEDGWDFDFDSAFHSPTPPLLLEGSGDVSGSCSATPPPQVAAAAVKLLKGTSSDSSASAPKTTSALLRQHREEKVFLLAAAGKPSQSIAQWPSIDPEGRWLQHCGLCVLAAAAGSQGYDHSLEALCTNFGGAEYRVRFFCERLLPQGCLLLVLPSRSRCLLLVPERIYSAGGLIWRVLGGEVQALSDSFDAMNFAACLARCRAV